MLRQSSPAGDVRAVAVRRSRVRATTKHEEDNVEEMEHGRALVSKVHRELTLRRDDKHGGGNRIGHWALMWP